MVQFIFAFEGTLNVLTLNADFRVNNYLGVCMNGLVERGCGIPKCYGTRQLDIL
jgi:hypothetical protein